MVKREFKLRYLKGILLFLAVFILLSASTLYIYFRVQLESVDEYKMYVRVNDEYSQLKIDNDVVAFSNMKPDMKDTRFIRLKNEGGEHLVEVVATGEIADWVDISDAKFTINENEEKEIQVAVSVPEEASLGEYDGKLLVIMHKT